MAALGRKSITSPIKMDQVISTSHRTSAEKGCFVAYTSDNVRFTLPIAYLDSRILREVLRLSEEEFGMRSQGPIVLPFESQFIGYVTALMQNKKKKANDHVEKALVLSMPAFTCSSSYYYSLHHQHTTHQIALCGY